MVVISGEPVESPEVNAVQDLLVYCLRGLASVVLKAKEAAISTREADIFTCESLFGHHDQC
jgi:hydroxylamine reductase